MPPPPPTGVGDHRLQQLLELLEQLEEEELLPLGGAAPYCSRSSTCRIRNGEQMQKVI